MRKTIWILLVTVVFILGVLVSDALLHGINTLFQRDIFITRASMREQLSECEKRWERLDEASRRQQTALSSLLQEMDDKDYFKLTKEALLSAVPPAEGEPGTIFLQSPTQEIKLSDQAGEGISTAIRKGINKQVETILTAAKGILSEKIRGLNAELVDMNDELRLKNNQLNEQLGRVESYRAQLKSQEQRISELQDIRREMKKAVMDLEMKIEDGRLRVNFQGDILFASGSHRLRPEGVALLRSVIPALKKSAGKNDIFVAGHTDNVPIKEEFRHKYASNWELSTYRAVEVVKYLVDKGLPPDRLTAAGYGEFKPVRENSSGAGRSANRRVELFVIPRIIQREK